MKLLNLRPMIWVDNVKVTINYYKTILGFTESDFVESWHWGWVKRDGIMIMFTNAHLSGSPNFTGSFYFNVDNADEWYEFLKDKTEMFYDIENFEFGMREFAIKDCNGYILQFGQDIEEEK